MAAENVQAGLAASSGAGLCAVVLSAGAGTRLAPLTEILPKPLCPVNGTPLVDLALNNAHSFTKDVAVNVHLSAGLLLEHLEGRVHLSIERGERLGTAGGVAALREWIADRDVLILNADAFFSGSLQPFVHGWDRDRISLLVAPDFQHPDFDRMWRFCGASLLPNRHLARLKDGPSGLYEELWRGAAATGRLQLTPFHGLAVDCGTLPDYLAANLVAAGSRLVLGRQVRYEGQAVDSVIWDNCTVSKGERLSRVVRATNRLTVQVP